MNSLVKIIVPAVSAVAAAAAGAALGVHFGYCEIEEQMKTYSVDTNGGPLRVGVISDLQLPDTLSKNTHQYRSFEKTLTMLRDRGMDVLIIAGDFTDVSSKKAWAHFSDIYDRVMAKVNKPVACYIMGNHDYWLADFVKAREIPSPAKLQKRFKDFTGEYPLSHKVVNGFHFICWGSLNGNYLTCNRNKKWAREQLDIAAADDPSKPIFVITHLNPADTAYGSDAWGNADIHEVLKDYPQAVSISGHSHYSLIDERSIWRKEYTAFTTQSLDYIELEDGKYNCSIPKTAYGDSMADKVPGCLYMLVEDDRVVCERLEANTGKALKKPWVIKAPFDKPNKHTDLRQVSNTAPVFEKNMQVKFGAMTDINGNSRKFISFNAARDDDFVHSYKLEFLDDYENVLEFIETDYDTDKPVLYNKNGEKFMPWHKSISDARPKYISELLYFSDFILGLDNMSKTVKLRLPNNVPENTKFIKITAVDSWNAESNPVICEIR